MSEETTKSIEAAAEQERAAVQGKLKEASDLLIEWAILKDSDSVRQQQQRNRDYAAACELLESLPYEAARNGLDLQLTVGTESIRTVRLRRNAYDLIERHSGPELESGQTITFSRSEGAVDATRRIRSVYLGGRDATLEVADIAEVLGSGGRVELVEEVIQEA